MNTQFDVVVIEIATGKIASIIGTGLDEARAEKRIETGISRINENYFVDMLPAGKYKVGDVKGDSNG